MKIGTRCTTCGRRPDEGEITTCETTFECQYCGDEPWIDAVEF